MKCLRGVVHGAKRQVSFEIDLSLIIVTMWVDIHEVTHSARQQDKNAPQHCSSSVIQMNCR